MVALCGRSVWWLCMVAPTLGWEAILTPDGQLEFKDRQADCPPRTERLSGWKVGYPALATCPISLDYLGWGLHGPDSMGRLDVQKGEWCTLCRSRQAATGAVAGSRC